MPIDHPLKRSILYLYSLPQLDLPMSNKQRLGNALEGQEVNER